MTMHVTKIIKQPDYTDDMHIVFGRTFVNGSGNSIRKTIVTCFVRTAAIKGWLLGVIRELKHQMFLVPRTPTGSIFTAWQPLRMSRRSWAAVTDWKREFSGWNQGFKFWVLEEYLSYKSRNSSSEIMFLNYSVGVRDVFTSFWLMICIWHANRVPFPVLRGQPCRSE